jgi:curved DNA-binding protein CbpA
MNEAYQVLSDAELRQRYNQFLGIQQEPTYSEDSLYA